MGIMFDYQQQVRPSSQKCSQAKRWSVILLISHKSEKGMNN